MNNFLLRVLLLIISFAAFNGTSSAADDPNPPPIIEVTLSAQDWTQGIVLNLATGEKSATTATQSYLAWDPHPTTGGISKINAEFWRGRIRNNEVPVTSAASPADFPFRWTKFDKLNLTDPLPQTWCFITRAGDMGWLEFVRVDQTVLHLRMRCWPKTARVVSGVVLNKETGAPMPEATVGIGFGTQSGDTFCDGGIETLTSSNGRFWAPVPIGWPPGHMNPEGNTTGQIGVDAQKSGYILWSSEVWTELPLNRELVDLEFILSTGASISGQVYDKVTRRGVPGVTISMVYPETNVLTDADGVYKFSGLKEGEYDLSRDPAPGYTGPLEIEQKHASLAPLDQLTGVDFPLQPASTSEGPAPKPPVILYHRDPHPDLTIAVVDAVNGRPISHFRWTMLPGIYYPLRPRGNSSQFPSHESFLVDMNRVDGTVKATRSERREATLFVRAPGYADQFVLVPASATIHTVRMEPKARTETEDYTTHTQMAPPQR